MAKWLRRWRLSETGQGLVEYALIISIVAVALMAVLLTLRNAAGNVYDGASNTVGQVQECGYASSASSCPGTSTSGTAGDGSGSQGNGGNGNGNNGGNGNGGGNGSGNGGGNGQGNNGNGNGNGGGNGSNGKGGGKGNQP